MQPVAVALSLSWHAQTIRNNNPVRSGPVHRLQSHPVPSGPFRSLPVLSGPIRSRPNFGIQFLSPVPPAPCDLGHIHGSRSFWPRGGVGLQQQLDDLREAQVAGDEKRSLPGAVGLVFVGRRLQQTPHHAEVSLARSNEEGRMPVLVSLDENMLYVEVTKVIMNQNSPN